jgi:hypothetical protein
MKGLDELPHERSDLTQCLHGNPILARVLQARLPGSIPDILNTQPKTRPNTQPISLDRPLIGLPPLSIALKASQC